MWSLVETEERNKSICPSNKICPTGEAKIQEKNLLLHARCDFSLVVRFIPSPNLFALLLHFINSLLPDQQHHFTFHSAANNAIHFLNQFRNKNENCPEAWETNQGFKKPIGNQVVPKTSKHIANYHSSLQFLSNHFFSNFPH